MAEPIVINNLIVDHVYALLKEKYDDEEYAKKYAEGIVEEKERFRSQGKFKNGNRLIDLYRHDIFGVLTPAGDLLSVFFIYDCEHVSYPEKHDVFMITAHDTLTEVSDDGSLDVEYTR